MRQKQNGKAINKRKFKRGKTSLPMKEPYEKETEPEINTTLSGPRQTHIVLLFSRRNEIKHRATPVQV